MVLSTHSLTHTSSTLEMLIVVDIMQNTVCAYTGGRGSELIAKGA